MEWTADATMGRRAAMKRQIERIRVDGLPAVLAVQFPIRARDSFAEHSHCANTHPTF
jgi:hypothetical protein